MDKKLENLKCILRKMKSVLVAFSGGIDSFLLLKIAKDVLGKDNVLAVTAVSATYPRDEILKAKALAKQLKVRHLIINTAELKDQNFVKNPINRCYYCKTELFRKLKKLAKKYKLNFVVDGSNLDDEKDFRPGNLALKKLKIHSPLREAGFTKEDIRRISKILRLPTWDKPALACLASRVPYGGKLTKAVLLKIDKAEKIIKDLGIKQVRARHYDGLVRIEVSAKDINKLIRQRKSIINKLKKLGYNYISLDLEGYRTGSLNEALR